jgi:hypothetical protein
MRSAVAPVMRAGGDHGEGHLVGAEQDEGDGEPEELGPEIRSDVAEPDEVEVAEQPAVAGVAEGDGEADQRPQHRHQAHGREVLHEHAEDVLAAHHPCVEEGEAWCHEQHQRRRHQHPRGVA